MYQNILVSQKSNSRFNNLNLESRMYEDNVIFINGEITDDTSYIVTQELLYLEASDPERDITMIINSPGGSVSAGIAIYDVMKSIKNDVVTVCCGQAASMGSFLLAGGTKGKRYIYPNAEVLIHQPLGGTQGQATEVLIVAEHMKNIKDKLNKILAKNTGQTVKKIEADTDRDNWMSAEQAKEYGIVDHIR